MFVVNKKDPRQKARQDWRTRVVPADCGPRYLAASLHLMFAPPHGSGLGSGAGHGIPRERPGTPGPAPAADGQTAMTCRP